LSSISRLVNPILNHQKLLAPVVMAGVYAILLPLFFIAVDTTLASAQVPPIPSLPDTITPDSQQPPPPTVSDGNAPTIDITSLEVGQQVSVGELAIEGVSSDNEETNCQVYADVNDIPPLQNATAAGLGGEDDFSKWTFTYTQDYQLITGGANELTAKISCFSGSGSTPVSEWHSINVTGVETSPAATTTTTEE
jgi:hypothetical protein